MTRAGIEATRERREPEKRKRDKEKLVEDLLEIARRAASYPRRDTRSLEEFLYDDRGLPR